MENPKPARAASASDPARARSKRASGAALWVSNLIMLALGIVIGFTGHWLLTAAMPSTPASPLDALVKNTRHFKGNANAPVTIIEISDFQ
ncbi:MAG: hypothetical protein L0Y55_15115 [Anaerolineales bacterium]|nr:hypothetical protein [Anaerolineales bacterium]